MWLKAYVHKHKGAQMSSDRLRTLSNPVRATRNHWLGSFQVCQRRKINWPIVLEWHPSRWKRMPDHLIDRGGLLPTIFQMKDSFTRLFPLFFQILKMSILFISWKTVDQLAENWNSWKPYAWKVDFFEKQKFGKSNFPNPEFGKISVSFATKKSLSLSHIIQSSCKHNTL